MDEVLNLASFVLFIGSYHCTKNFETIDDFAQCVIKGEFYMFDARQDDDEWIKAAERGDYENILMLKFEDIIGS